MDTPPITDVADTIQQRRDRDSEQRRRLAAAGDPDRRHVTGVRSAFVTVRDREVVVRQGQQLPDGVSDAELDRLDRLGVFAPDTPPPPPSRPDHLSASDRLQTDTSRILAETNQRLLDRSADAERAAAEHAANPDPDVVPYPMDRPWTDDEQVRYETENLQRIETSRIGGLIDELLGLMVHPDLTPAVLALAEAITTEPGLLDDATDAAERLSDVAHAARR